MSGNPTSSTIEPGEGSGEVIDATDNVVSAPSIADPNLLAAEIISDLPVMQSVEDRLVNVLTLAILYVGSEGRPPLQNVSSDVALAQVGLRSQPWTKDTISADCFDILQAVEDCYAEVNNEFATSTSSPLQGEFLQKSDLEARTSEEIKEQSELTTKSDGLLRDVNALRITLDIPRMASSAAVQDDASLRQEAPPEPEIRKKRGLFGKLANIGGAFIDTEKDAPVLTPSAQAPKSVETIPERASWTTPPLWTDEDEVIRRFRLINQQVKGVADPQTVWSTFKLLGITRDEISGLLNGVEDIARKQVLQSQSIISNITGENEHFLHQVDTISQVARIVLAVVNFFNVDTSRLQQTQSA